MFRFNSLTHKNFFYIVRYQALEGYQTPHNTRQKNKTVGKEFYPVENYQKQIVF